MSKSINISEKSENKWAAIAVSQETHRQIKIAAAIAGLQISEFMASLAAIAIAEAEKMRQSEQG